MSVNEELADTLKSEARRWEKELQAARLEGAEEERAAAEEVIRSYVFALICPMLFLSMCIRMYIVRVL